MRKWIAATAAAAILSVAAAAPAMAGWEQDERGWRYLYDDGRGAAVGDALVEGEYFWFGDDGYMLTGWRNKQGRWLYYDADGRKASGWREVDGKWYYLEDGVMKTGWLDDNGKRYYLQGDGMVIGQFEVGGLRYEADPTGAIYQNRRVSATMKYDENGILVAKSKATNNTWEAVSGTEMLLEDLKDSFFDDYVEYKKYATRGEFEQAVRETLGRYTSSQEDIEEFLDYAEEEFDEKNGKLSGHYYSEYTDYDRDDDYDDEDYDW